MAIDNITRLRHMIDAAKEAISFSNGKSREDLESDRLLLLALVKDLEIIGEAASKLTPEIRARYPQLPWIDIITDVTWNEDCPHPPAPSPREERGSKVQKIFIPLALWERG